MTTPPTPSHSLRSTLLKVSWQEAAMDTAKQNAERSKKVHQKDLLQCCYLAVEHHRMKQLQDDVTRLSPHCPRRRKPGPADRIDGHWPTHQDPNPLPTKRLALCEVGLR